MAGIFTKINKMEVNESGVVPNLAYSFEVAYRRHCRALPLFMEE